MGVAGTWHVDFGPVFRDFAHIHGVWAPVPFAYAERYPVTSTKQPLGLLHVHAGHVHLASLG